MRTTYSVLAALGAAGLLATGASGAILGGAEGVEVEQYSSQWDTTNGAVNTINGSGLDDSDSNPLNWTHGDGYPGGGSAGFAWHTNGGETPDGAFITYDLGGVYDLNSVLVWNFNNRWTGGSETGRGYNQYDLYVAGDGIDPTNLGNFTQIVTDGTLNEASGTAAETAQVINVAGLANGVRYVRIDADSNFGTAGPYTGLSEVRFDVVPEPGSLALLGLGGLLVARRRRQG